MCISFNWIDWTFMINFCLSHCRNDCHNSQFLNTWPFAPQPQQTGRCRLHLSCFSSLRGGRCSSPREVPQLGSVPYSCPRNEIDLFRALLATEKPEIVGITENWIHTNTRDFEGEFEIPGYKTFKKDRLDREGGGVMLYVRGHLDPVECK